MTSAVNPDTICTCTLTLASKEKLKLIFSSINAVEIQGITENTTKVVAKIKMYIKNLKANVGKLYA